MIRILGTIFAGLLGLAFGSFLNVCLSRWPAGESVVAPRSHCRNCDHTLAWWENIPILSWIVLRGRCRKCGTAISWRYPLVELAVGVLWAILWWHQLGRLLRDHAGFPLRGAALAADVAIGVGMALFSLILVGIAVLDAEELWIPDAVTLPGITAGLLYSISLIWESVLYITVQPPIWTTIAGQVLGVLAAAALILFIRWLYKLIRHREGIGLGDAKLMALLAAWLGLPGALLSFALAAILGSLTALVLLATRRSFESWAATKLPFGTFLCIGGIVSSLWGESIIRAYLRWTGL